jgi:acyl-CoA oxidase
MAKVCSWRFAGDKLMKMWGKNTKHLITPNNPKLAELHSLISVLKALMSWEGVKGLNECRRACGGLGYSQYSGFGRMMQNIDIY